MQESKHGCSAAGRRSVTSRTHQRTDEQGRGRPAPPYMSFRSPVPVPACWADSSALSCASERAAASPAQHPCCLAEPSRPSLPKRPDRARYPSVEPPYSKHHPTGAINPVRRIPPNRIASSSTNSIRPLRDSPAAPLLVSLPSSCSSPEEARPPAHPTKEI